ncbi:hypothetical protein D3C80_1820170 [compost metagenome]
MASINPYINPWLMWDTSRNTGATVAGNGGAGWLRRQPNLISTSRNRVTPAHLCHAYSFSLVGDRARSGM